MIPALHVLNRLNKLRAVQLIPYLTHLSADVRIHTIQLCASRLSDSDLLEAVIQAANKESNARVQIEFALVLGETQSPASLPVLADYARKSIETPWMADAILSSVHGRSAKLLDILLKEGHEADPFIQFMPPD
ncbi:HEAT repeat domain-containing protein [Opitutia bacterium ISCC 51]|nr:HEAT repeat domain-containing protein [Opitutae bacterium ISCC 51]QXD30263.1 HEAT repeat domain-containing protein [Opitutae bacterium ISCC 52]